ncbi:hypothetical protein [Metapseudomonas otitidis]|uniref:hypothetical protein n=1 Tax=Metapseudomonas otitidis TaxID=319939 RepID=UPI0013F5D022|nr:hypothetical protein [Pseudomonas otitidis]
MQHNTTRELSPVEIEAYKQRLIEEAEESRRARFQGRRRIEALFDGFRDCEPVDEELEAELAALDSLLSDTQVQKEGSQAITKPALQEEHEPSFLLDRAFQHEGRAAFSSPEAGERKRPLAKRTAKPATAISGVDAKSSRRRATSIKLSTARKAGLLANFQSMRERNVAAISELDPDLDHEQIAQIEAKISFIIRVAHSYAGKGSSKLADWSKHVPAEIKQFFRLLWLARQPEAVAVTIRLDHSTATKALDAKRGPANHLAGIIQRTLAKLEISTDLAFNLEYTHGASTENHPLHLHGIMRIPADRIEEVRLALRSALAEGYRQRFGNLAVHAAEISNPRWWAGYCTKEHGISADILKTARGKGTVPDYACHSARDGGKTLYERIGELFSDEG